MKLPVRHLRQQAYTHQSGLCYYCQCPMWTVSCSEFAQTHSLSLKAANRFQCSAEHLRPVGQGGLTTADNIVAACVFCNRTRHKARKVRTPEDFAIYVRRRIAAKRWNQKFR